MLIKQEAGFKPTTSPLTLSLSKNVQRELLSALLHAKKSLLAENSKETSSIAFPVIQGCIQQKFGNRSITGCLHR